jgi:hypothetical protein
MNPRRAPRQGKLQPYFVERRQVTRDLTAPRPHLAENVLAAGPNISEELRVVGVIGRTTRFLRAHLRPRTTVFLLLKDRDDVRSCLADRARLRPVRRPVVPRLTCSVYVTLHGVILLVAMRLGLVSLIAVGV